MVCMPKINSSDVRPPYVQIADDLRAAIEGGQMKPGERLPSGRALADSYGVAPMTVQHALSVLRDEGRITTWQGRGAFVTDEQPTDEPPADDLAKQVRALAETVRQLDERITQLEDGR